MQGSQSSWSSKRLCINIDPQSDDKSVFRLLKQAEERVSNRLGAAIGFDVANARS